MERSNFTQAGQLQCGSIGAYSVRNPRKDAETSSNSEAHTGCAVFFVSHHVEHTPIYQEQYASRPIPEELRPLSLPLERVWPHNSANSILGVTIVHPPKAPLRFRALLGLMRPDIILVGSLHPGWGPLGGWYYDPLLRLLKQVRPQPGT